MGTFRYHVEILYREVLSIINRAQLHPTDVSEIRMGFLRLFSAYDELQKTIQSTPPSAHAVVSSVVRDFLAETINEIVPLCEAAKVQRNLEESEAIVASLREEVAKLRGELEITQWRFSRLQSSARTMISQLNKELTTLRQRSGIVADEGSVGAVFDYDAYIEQVDEERAKLPGQITELKAEIEKLQSNNEMHVTRLMKQYQSMLVQQEDSRRKLVEHFLNERNATHDAIRRVRKNTLEHTHAFKFILGEIRQMLTHFKEELYEAVGDSTSSLVTIEKIDRSLITFLTGFSESILSNTTEDALGEAKRVLLAKSGEDVQFQLVWKDTPVIKALMYVFDNVKSAHAKRAEIELLNTSLQEQTQNEIAKVQEHFKNLRSQSHDLTFAEWIPLSGIGMGPNSMIGGGGTNSNGVPYPLMNVVPPSVTNPSISPYPALFNPNVRSNSLQFNTSKGLINMFSDELNASHMSRDTNATGSATTTPQYTKKRGSGFDTLDLSHRNVPTVYNAAESAEVAKTWNKPQDIRSVLTTMKDLLGPGNDGTLPALNFEQFSAITAVEAENKKLIKERLVCIYRRVVKRARMKVLFKRARKLELAVLEGELTGQYNHVLRKYVALERQLENEISQITTTMVTAQDDSMKRIQEQLTKIPADLLKRVVVQQALQEHEKDPTMNSVPNVDLLSQGDIVSEGQGQIIRPKPRPPRNSVAPPRRKSEALSLTGTGKDKPLTAPTHSNPPPAFGLIGQSLNANTKGDASVRESAVSRKKRVQSMFPAEEYEDEYDEKNLLRITSAAPVDPLHLPKPSTFGQNESMGQKSRAALLASLQGTVQSSTSPSTTPTTNTEKPVSPTKISPTIGGAVFGKTNNNNTTRKATVRIEGM